MRIRRTCNQALNQQVSEDGLWPEVTTPLTEVRTTAHQTANVRHIVYYVSHFARGGGQR